MSKCKAPRSPLRKRFVTRTSMAGTTRQLASFDFAHDPHQDDSAHNRYQNGVDGAALPGETEQPHDPAANHSAHYAKNDVAQGAVAGTFHDFACRPTGDQANQNPPDKMQHTPSFWKLAVRAASENREVLSRPYFAATILVLCGLNVPCSSPILVPSNPSDS